MTREEIDERAEQYGCQTPVLEDTFANFDSAIEGYAETAGGIRVIYDRQKCLQCLVDQNEDMTYEKAEEILSGDVERAIPYMGVLHPLMLRKE